MSNGKLLWVDDEIELLRAHILFLEKKGYHVSTVTNGYDAIELCRKQQFDLIFLDENMVGLSGLETLSLIKEIAANTPVVMVTKSEEEDIMNQAIGAKIADYLIKPVNPNQILLSLKKNIHHREIVSEVAQTTYQQNFGKIGMQINDSLTHEDWIEAYKRLVFWELELTNTDSGMDEMLRMQKADANQAFSKFIKRNYLDWLTSSDTRPVLSTDVFKKSVFPWLDQGEKVFFIVIDNFRYDQWRAISPLLSDSFTIDESLYYTILPTVTQYARNAMFSGLMPNMISEMFPDLWADEDDEHGKNLNEAPLIQTHFDRYRKKVNFSYHKINDSSQADKLLAQFKTLEQNDLNVVVFNFIDIMSHARTDSKMMRELASNEAAYRSITQSWFQHSAVKELFKRLAQTSYRVILTTDHGSIRVDKPIKVIGNKSTNSNLRYKLGKSLTYNPKDVFEIRDPRKAMLPSPHISTGYIFATNNDFMVYPNNYNHYASYYSDTFQHGGVSMEEMIVPLVTLQSKRG